LQVWSSLDTQVTSDNPFLPFYYLSAFMDHALGAMAMQEGKADLEIGHDRLGRRIFALLPLWWVWVENCLSADASSSRRSEVQ
jgi:hypothetical protein